MQSKFAGKCKDGCGAQWEIGADISKNESTGHWCSNPNCPTPNGQEPVQSAPKQAPSIPKITPEDALKEVEDFHKKFEGVQPMHFESLAKIYISRMMSNR